MNLIHFDKINHPIYTSEEIEWVYAFQVVEGTKLFLPYEQHPQTVIQVDHNPDGFTIFIQKILSLLDLALIQRFLGTT